jgi:hypothetical protein
MSDASVIIPGVLPVRQGRPPINKVAMTNQQKMSRRYLYKKSERLKHIAVLDMETDPFNDQNPEAVYPFCAELYSDQFGSIVIWDEDYETLIEKILTQIEALPDCYTIYAHNGGKFDYMFFIHKLRGIVKFKGRAIMSAKIGNHEIRDSLHLLPEKLAAWKKDKFDYSKMHKKNRQRFKEEILTYLHSDCLYLFDFLKRFTSEFGLKISIGQAAFAELKKHYKIASIKPSMDTALRAYFLGGRVECIAGMGYFDSARYPQPYKLYDVNSMYWKAMSDFRHPVGAEYLWHRGEPNENTCFIDLNCYSYGAMFKRLETGELSTDDGEGRFHTTIHEYRMALKLGLIENVRINWCVDNLIKTDFSKFILPMYQRREETKIILARLKSQALESTSEYEEIKKENIFLKYLGNNSWGKTAQNPLKYKEYCFTDHGQMPDREWFDFLDTADENIRHEYSFPVERCNTHDVWARPNPGVRFNNVGTGASITGAARAILLEARQNATDPIYCDTDSLICRELRNVDIHPSRLGAWDLEETFDEVIIAGKKTYACRIAGKPDCAEGRIKVRSKGVDLRVRPERIEAGDDEWTRANAATWQRYLDIIDDKIISIRNAAPTFSKLGAQHFMTRRIKATAPRKRILHHGNARSIQNG